MDEFKVHRLNENGLAKADQIGSRFAELLGDLEALIPPGRERSLVVTKLQEAAFFAKRGIAILPENQLDAPPGSIGLRA